MRKLLDCISVISAVLTLSMSGGILYSYLYITNPVNQEKTKGFVMDEIKKMLPELMHQSLISNRLAPMALQEHCANSFQGETDV